MKNSLFIILGIVFLTHKVFAGTIVVIEEGTNKVLENKKIEQVILARGRTVSIRMYTARKDTPSCTFHESDLRNWDFDKIAFLKLAMKDNTIIKCRGNSNGSSPTDIILESSEKE